MATTSSKQIDSKIIGYVLLTFFGYFTIGLSLATLPVYIHQVLGYNTVIAGLVISLQYVATFLLRGYAGKIVDTRGPKVAVKWSMILFSFSGILLFLVFHLTSDPHWSLIILIVTRFFTGAAEGLVGASPINWSLLELGDKYAAKAISFNGVASYGALAVGAPLGVYMVHQVGYQSIAILTFFVGVIAYIYTRTKPAFSQKKDIQKMTISFWKILSQVAPYGTCLALGGLGFGSISTFITLYYEHFQWSKGALCLSIFGMFFIATRLLFSRAIDNYGGIKVALISLFVESVGLLLIALANTPHLTLLGAALSGFGFSLVFPALGVEAIKKVSQSNHGSALAAYGLFIDISLGITGPLIGLVASKAGIEYIYPFSMLIVLVGFLIVGYLALKNKNMAS